MNKKSASICDFVISKRLDLLALTETWLSRRHTEHLSVAEITNTLQNYVFFHQSRTDKAGGGVGLLLRKWFTVKVNEVSKFKSMEYMDFKITARDASFRLLVIYRIHPSRKKKLTSAMFFEEFSTLLENLIVTPEYLLLTGDFNFHMDIPSYPDTSKFNDLLESAGLKQSVTGSTHRCVHTLDLVIDRQESMLSPLLETLSDIPSDHYGVVGSLNFPKPHCTTKSIQRRDLKRLEQTQWSNDVAVLLDCNLLSDVDAMTNHFNTILRYTLSKHAPEKLHSIRLRPSSPWFSDDLRKLKRERRLCERKCKSSNLEIHRQLYRDAAVLILPR